MTITSYLNKKKTAMKSDHLRYNSNNAFLVELTKNIYGIESIKFSDSTQKINRRKEQQLRHIVVTDRAIYSLTVQNVNLRRRIPLQDITRVYYSKNKPEIIICFKWCWNDYRLNLVHFKEFLNVLRLQYKRIFNRDLKECVVDPSDFSHCQAFRTEIRSFDPDEASRCGSSLYSSLNSLKKERLFEKYNGYDLIEALRSSKKLEEEHWKTGKEWEPETRTQGLLARRINEGLEIQCSYIVDSKLLCFTPELYKIMFFTKDCSFTVGLTKQEIKQKIFIGNLVQEDASEFKDGLLNLMNATLASHKDKKQFRDFLNDSLMVEYLDCYDAIIDFKRTDFKVPEKVKEGRRKALAIINKYLAKNADYELANANELLPNINSALLGGEFTKFLFEELESKLYFQVLYNAFFRFYSAKKEKIEKQGTKTKKLEKKPSNQLFSVFVNDSKYKFCTLCREKVNKKSLKWNNIHDENYNCVVCDISVCEKHRFPFLGNFGKDYGHKSSKGFKRHVFCILCYYTLTDRVVRAFSISTNKDKKSYTLVFGCYSEADANDWVVAMGSKCRYYHTLKMSDVDKKVISTEFDKDIKSEAFSYMGEQNTDSVTALEIENFLESKNVKQDAVYKTGELMIMPIRDIKSEVFPPKEGSYYLISIWANVLTVNSLNLTKKVDLRYISKHRHSCYEQKVVNEHQKTAFGIKNNGFLFGFSVWAGQNVERFQADSEESRRNWLEAFDNCAIKTESNESDYENLGLRPFSVKKSLNAPNGYLVFVLTDIQNSTKLWEALGEVMKDSLTLHNKIMRNLLDKHDGHELRTEGDAFIVAFESAAHAVRWCMDAQESLNNAKWPDKLLEHPSAQRTFSSDNTIIFSGLRVRMGVHSGMPETKINHTTGMEEYVGPVMHKANIISNTGSGGQIVLTPSVVECLAKEEDSFCNKYRCNISSLGLYSFEELDNNIELYQIKSNLLVGRLFGDLRFAKKLDGPVI